MKILLVLLFVAGTLSLSIPANLFEDFNFENHPKCCPENEHLNKSLQCEQFPQGHFQIYAKEILKDFQNDCTLNQSCIDILEDSGRKLVKMTSCGSYEVFTQYNSYPKCCPLNYSYDSKEHHCVRDNSSDGNLQVKGNLLVLNISLWSCPNNTHAVKDYKRDFFVDESKKAFIVNDGKSINYGLYCIDKDAEDQSGILRACQPYSEVCLRSFGDKGLPCLRKCCPDGEIYKIPDGCIVDYDNGGDIAASNRITLKNDSDYAIIHNFGRKYVAFEDYSFAVDQKGTVRLKINKEWSSHSSDKVTYCVENSYIGKTLTLTDFIVAEKETVSIPLKTIALALSVCFLFFTILAYLFLPDMQNLHGKSIIMHCLILLVAFLILSFVNSIRMKQDNLCISLGFSLMFAFLGAFSWLNVICFDMWMAFGTLRVLDVTNKRKERRKFLWYNLYGWGVPVSITTAAVAIFITKCLPEQFVPRLGNSRCFFDNSGYDYYLYFITPMTLMILVNCVLFYKTVRYCCRVKNEIQRMQERTKKNKFNEDNEKMIMLLKLFILMGISWLFEIVSSMINFKGSNVLAVIETVWDIFNSSQGILIFVIFIMKKKVYHLFKQKLGFEKVRKPSECSDVTMTTNFSSARSTKNCYA